MYFHFETRASDVKVDLAKLCEHHARKWSQYCAEGITHRPTTPASYWLHEETTATFPDFPGLTLHLDEVPTPGVTWDLRTHAWCVRRVTFEEDAQQDFVCWTDPSDSLSKAAEFFRKMSALLTTMAGSGTSTP